MGRPWKSMHLPISRNDSHTRRKMDVGCRKAEHWVLELYDHGSSLPQIGPVYVFARAALTEHHRLWLRTTENHHLAVLKAGKSRMKMSVGMISSEAVGENLFQASLLGLKVAFFTSHVSPCACLCIQITFFYKVARAFQAVLMVKNPPANAGDIKDMHSIPGSGRSPEEGMATHSGILS